MAFADICCTEMIYYIDKYSDGQIVLSNITKSLQYLYEYFG